MGNKKEKPIKLPKKKLRNPYAEIGHGRKSGAMRNSQDKRIQDSVKKVMDDWEDIYGKDPYDQTPDFMNIYAEDWYSDNELSHVPPDGNDILKEYIDKDEK